MSPDDPLTNAPLCGHVIATCQNEPDHPGEHWYPTRMEAALREIAFGSGSGPKHKTNECSGIRRLRNIARAALAEHPPSIGGNE